MLSDLPNRGMLVVPLSIRFRCQNVEDWGSSPHLYQLRLTLVVAPICHFCAVFLRSRDVTSRKKAREQLGLTDSVGQHRSDYQLCVAGALRQSTGVVSDSFFESDRTASEAVGSVVYDEI